MTCHHRTDFTLPRWRVGAPKRCRCQVAEEPMDHCHQQATGEDMRCDWCREICTGGGMTLNPEQVGVDCDESGCRPDWMARRLVIGPGVGWSAEHDPF